MKIIIIATLLCLCASTAYADTIHWLVEESDNPDEIQIYGGATGKSSFKEAISSTALDGRKITIWMGDINFIGIEKIRRELTSYLATHHSVQLNEIIDSSTEDGYSDTSILNKPIMKAVTSTTFFTHVEEVLNLSGQPYKISSASLNDLELHKFIDVTSSSKKTGYYIAGTLIVTAEVQP